MQTDVSHSHHLMDDGLRRLRIVLGPPCGLSTDVRACEVRGAKFQNVIKFRSGLRIGEVFVPKLAAALTEALLSLPEDAAITDLDTPFIECRGLVLYGGSIIRDAGAETVEFLFTNFLGGLNRAFRGNIGFDDPLLDSNDRISALVLSDIALPLLNICQDAERRIGHFGEPGSQFEHQIASRSDEIRFQIELIKRYVQSLN